MKAEALLARIKTIFGGLTARLFVALGAMALTTAAAVGIGNLVFRDIASGLYEFVEVRVPQTREGAELVSAANAFRDILAGILTAEDKAAISGQRDAVKLSVQRVTSLAGSLPVEARDRLKPLLGKAESSLLSLAQARWEEIANLNRIDEIVAQTLATGDEASAAFIEASDSAFFDLALGGEDTIEIVDTAFADLVDGDFAILQVVLQTRAEVNLLTGLTLALAESRGSDLQPILRDLSSAARDKLVDLVDDLAAHDQLADVTSTVDQVLELTEGANAARNGDRREILAVRQDADAATSSALDDIVFELTIRTGEVSASNEVAIQQLLDQEVAQIRELASLDIATRNLFATALQAALAPNADRAHALQTEMSAAAEKLEESAKTQSEVIQQRISALSLVADPELGIVPARLAVLSARDNGTEAIHSATENVRSIVWEANDFGTSALHKIGSTADVLSDKVAAAQTQMLTIAVVGVGLIVAIPFLAIATIIRPLRRVAATTERLSQGDLSEVAGLDRAVGEIGRMGAALKVFRESMIDQIRLQKEEAERGSAERERAAREEKDAREREEAERARKDEADRERREREAEELAAREELRAAAEAERQERTAEQERVVAQLAEGMKNLSSGRLDFRIATAFPEAYESLRLDFNEAVGALADLIQAIAESAGKIDLSSGEIAAAADDLSRRTENSAATLEQTAASLNELTASVTSTAEGAGHADGTVQSTKSSAEQSSEVVREAVSAMSQIETSSKQISKIIDVIDDIAFQTNLLALNAGVEAARAGDAGRGFAVVASEVRALAQRSSEAAREINGLISDSNTHVERGVTLVDKAGDALQAIIESFGEISQHVGEIASSAREQATGITEINAAASQLDEATQQNAAMFEESTAASRILTEEARKLAGMVARFTISGQAALDGGWTADTRRDQKIA